MRTLWFRLANALRPSRAEGEMNREIAAHLSVIEEEYRRRGLTAEEARLAARRAFGGVEQAKELHRDERSVGLLDDLGRDVRYALQTLRRNPGFTAVAVLTLALGIGVNVAMFSVLYASVLRPLPYPSPEQLVMLWTERPSQGVREGRSTYSQVEDWRANSTSVADMAVFDPVSTTLTGSADWQQLSVVRASPNLFTILGVRPAAGRLLSQSDAEERRSAVVVSHRFWQTRLGGDPSAVGSTVELDGAISEVVGILPREFSFGDGVDLWQPHTLFADWEARRRERDGGSWFVLGRLRPGIGLARAQAEMNAMARRLDEGQTAAGQERGISMVPLSVHLVGTRARLALWMLSGAVLCVLLIGVANITSLSLARSAARSREIAIRSALGAGHARIVRQLLTEAVTLAVLAGIAGFVFAVVATPLLDALRPDAAIAENRPFDLPVLAWALGLSIATGLAVGMMPALLMRPGSLRPSLDESSRGSSAARSTRLMRQTMVVAEFALALVLLVGAGLLIRSLARVQHVDPGFSTERVLSVQLSLPPSRADARTEHYERILEHLRGIGAVEEAGVIGDLFIGGSAEQTVTVEGGSRPYERLRLRRDEISARFFDTLRVPLIAGRHFSADDRATSMRVAIVNSTMARRLWPGRDPIGQRFKVGPIDADAPWFTVVGVAGDMRRQNLETEPIAQMFEPLAQNPSRLATLVIRTTTASPDNLFSSVQAAIRQVDTRTFVYGAATLEDRLTQFSSGRRFQTTLLIVFSLLALVLAAIGIYGVVQYSIATRTREIGIRMAVGAGGGEIFRLIVGEGLTLSAVGLVLGIVGALWLGRIGSSLLFGVSATDLPTYAAVSVVLVTVAAAGCVVPARRAAHVDPLTALRYE